MGINLNRHEGITSNLSLEKELNVIERSSLRVLQSSTVQKPIYSIQYTP